MSLFYKNERSSQNPPIEEYSRVRPYGQPEQYPSLDQKPHATSKQPPKHHDPIFGRMVQAHQPEADPLRKSILLANKEGEEESWLTKCCNCYKLEVFKQYFTVSNEDVLKRILLNLQFWRSSFFAPEQKYDFYGPFWILTTVVFCLSAVPNIILYQATDNFEYNFEIVGLAFGFVYLEGLLFPVILTFVLKFLGVDCTYIQNICIYGYGMCIAIICLLLCSFNVCLLHYIVLGYAFTTKALFILNNMNAAYQIPVAKKLLFSGLVIGEAALQFFIVKFFFISCAEPQPSRGAAAQLHHHAHQRQFQF